MSENEYNTLLQQLRNAGSALFRIPIFYSHPSFRRLNENQALFASRLFKSIKTELLFPRTLPGTEQYPETVLVNIRRLILSSYGMLAVNFKGAETPFLQIEPTMSFQYGLPILLVKENGILEEGVWRPGTAPFYLVTWYSETTTVNEFFNSVEWKEILQNWSSEVRNGYYIKTNPEYKY